MKKKTTNLTGAAVTGMMIGAAVGMTAKSMMQPKKMKISKKAGKALKTVGEMMENVSSFLG